jgi:hypothetical protein
MKTKQEIREALERCEKEECDTCPFEAIGECFRAALEWVLEES